MVQKAGYQRNLLSTAIAGALGSFSFGYNLGSLNAIELEMQKCSREVEWDKITLSKERLLLSQLLENALLSLLVGFICVYSEWLFVLKELLDLPAEPTKKPKSSLDLVPENVETDNIKEIKLISDRMRYKLSSIRDSIYGL